MRYILLTLASLLVAATYTAAQEVASIKGHIRTSDGHPAQGITIGIGGTDRQSISDADGYFILKGLTPGSYTISVSSVGLLAVQRQIVLRSGESTAVDFVLNETAQVLAEVTVDAQRRRLISQHSNYVSKMPLTRLENAQTYTTVTRAVLDQQQALTLEDGIKNVAGVAKIWDATGRAGDGGTYFVSRGFVTTARLRNGVAANVTNTTDAFNLESFEVIKGPAATLFGNRLTSYGGLINRVTKKPYETFGGEVGYTAGSYGLNRLTADVNVPLTSDNSVLFRLNGVYQTENSFQDYGFKKTFAIAPSLTFRANDKLSFQLDAELFDFRQAGMPQVIYSLPPSQINGTLTALLAAQGLDEQTIAYVQSLLPTTFKEAFGTDRADEIPLNYRRSYMGNDIVGTGSSANFFGQMTYTFNDQWESNTLVSSAHNSYAGDMPYFYLLPNYLESLVTSLLGGQAPSVGTPGVDKMMRMAWRPTGKDNMLQIQQNFAGDFQIGTLRNRIVAGLDWFNQVSDNSYNRYRGRIFGVIPYQDVFDVVNVSGEVPNYQNLNKGKLDSAYAAGDPLYYTSYTKVNTYSAYVSDVMNITDRLLISAGLRIDHFDNRGNYQPTSGTYTGGYNQTALSPKFGIVFQPLADRLSVFGNYQSGFTNQTGADKAGNAFKPEQAFQWEGGIRSDLLNSRLVATVSYYDVKVNNIVRSDPDDPNFSIQRGNRLSRGIEAEINAQPIDGMNFILGYAYNDSKMEGAGPDVDGLRPGDAGAEHLANWWLAYTFPKTLLKGVGIGAGGNYVGEIGVYNSNFDGRFMLPSYTTWAASLFLDKQKYRLAARVNNLTNKKHWVGWTTMNPQMPRQFLLSLTYKF